MSIKNEAKKSGFLARKLRSFFEHRALWLYFICDEARKKGIKPENFVPAAIRLCGIYHGLRALTGKDADIESLSAMANNTANKKGVNCRMLQKRLFPSIGKLIFEMKFIRLDDDAFDVDFHYCPLVSAWQKQGCSAEEIDILCDWAMEGDRGIVEAFNCKLELNKTIAKGDGICELRIKRK